MKLYLIPAILVISTLTACDQGKDNSSEEQTTQEMNITDQHSYSKPEDVAVKHLTLDLTVNFDKKQLSGTAILDIESWIIYPAI